MIHITVGEATASKLREAMEYDKHLEGEIFVLEDALSIGRINPQGEEHDALRKDFWIGQGIMYMENLRDAEIVEEIIRKAKKEEEPVALWMAPNADDVCAYYFLLTKFREEPGMFHTMNIQGLPFLNEKTEVFYPLTFQEVEPKEFVKMKRLLKEISLAEYEMDGEEWQKLCNENGSIRLYKGGKDIETASETVLDNSIYMRVGVESIKGSRLIRSVLKNHPGIHPFFVKWRIKEMIKNGQLGTSAEIQKDVSDMDLFKPKNKEDISVM